MKTNIKQRWTVARAVLLLSLAAGACGQPEVIQESRDQGGCSDQDDCTQAEYADLETRRQLRAVTGGDFTEMFLEDIRLDFRAMDIDCPAEIEGGRWLAVEGKQPLEGEFHLSYDTDGEDFFGAHFNMERDFKKATEEFFGNDLIGKAGIFAESADSSSGVYVLMGNRQDGSIHPYVVEIRNGEQFNLWPGDADFDACGGVRLELDLAGRTVRIYDPMADHEVLVDLPADLPVDSYTQVGLGASELDRGQTVYVDRFAFESSLETAMSRMGPTGWGALELIEEATARMREARAAALGTTESLLVQVQQAIDHAVETLENDATPQAPPAGAEEASVSQPIGGTMDPLVRKLTLKSLSRAGRVARRAIAASSVTTASASKRMGKLLDKLGERLVVAAANLTGMRASKIKHLPIHGVLGKKGKTKGGTVSQGSGGGSGGGGASSSMDATVEGSTPFQAQASTLGVTVDLSGFAPATTLTGRSGDRELTLVLAYNPLLPGTKVLDHFPAGAYPVGVTSARFRDGDSVLSSTFSAPSYDSSVIVTITSHADEQRISGSFEGKVFDEQTQAARAIEGSFDLPFQYQP